MGKLVGEITEADTTFILAQHMFFVGTAPKDISGRLNLSPKGLDSFKVINKNQVGYMDVVGSGNETSAHLLENGRITFMFCSYDKVPLILRLYGSGKIILKDNPKWDEYASHFTILPSTRQLIIADIDTVQNSCGYGIPFYEYKGDRPTHFKWAEKKGVEGLKEYIKQKNTKSIDGLNTNHGLRIKGE